MRKEEEEGQKKIRLIRIRSSKREKTDQKNKVISIDQNGRSLEKDNEVDQKIDRSHTDQTNRSPECKKIEIKADPSMHICLHLPPDEEKKQLNYLCMALFCCKQENKLENSAG